MSVDRFAGGLRRGDLAEDFAVAGEDAGDIHHLAERDEFGMGGEQAGRIGGGERGAGGLEGRCGDAARQREAQVGRRPFRVGEPEFEARFAHHVRDLVRVADCRKGALRGDETSETRGREMRGFDVHVRVDECGQTVEAVRRPADEWFHGGNYTMFGACGIIPA